jgi:hypothetical protein
MSGSAKDSLAVLLISSVVDGFDGEMEELCAILNLLVFADRREIIHYYIFIQFFTVLFM